MRLYYDTEFIERGPGHPIDLISIGVVADDDWVGRGEFYAVSLAAPLEHIQEHPWLMDNVVPHLPMEVDEYGHLTFDPSHQDWENVWAPAQIRDDLVAFIQATQAASDDQTLELWGWYADYDHVVLAQLFGTMVDMPQWMPYYTRDLKQEADRLGVRVPLPMPEAEHNALADARWNREVGLWLSSQTT